MEAFAGRVNAAFEETVARHAGRHVLIVAHGGVIRALVGRVLQAPPRRWYRTQVSYACMTRVRSGRFGAVLDFHNHRCALGNAE